MIISKFELMKTIHADVYEALVTLRSKLQHPQTLEDLTDQILCLREIAKLADDLRKETTKLQETAERVVCVLWATGKCVDTIKGEYATGIPDIRQAASLPNGVVIRKSIAH